MKTRFAKSLREVAIIGQRTNLVGVSIDAETAESMFGVNQDGYAMMPRDDAAEFGEYYVGGMRQGRYITLHWVDQV